MKEPDRIDAIFQEADKLFAKMDEAVKDAFKKNPNSGANLSEDAQTANFRALTPGDRLRLCGRFCKMAANVLVKGEASIKFRERKP